MPVHTYTDFIIKLQITRFAGSPSFDHVNVSRTTIINTPYAPNLCYIGTDHHIIQTTEIYVVCSVRYGNRLPSNTSTSTPTILPVRYCVVFQMMAQLLGLAQFSTSCLLTCQFKEQQRISNQSPILPNICQVYTNLSRSESICDDDRKTMRKNSQHTSLANEVCQNFDSVLVLPHYTLYDTACRVLSYYRR